MSRSKIYDYECTECGARREAFAYLSGEDKPLPQRGLVCGSCDGMTAHDRLISAPARYMGETILNPIVSGGTFDTTGHKPLPPLPDLPGADEHAAKVAERVACVPDNAPAAERREAYYEAARDAPTDADYSSLFASSEWKTAQAERARIKKENAEKRKRKAALDRGENINFRRDKCAGDPALTA